MIKTLHKEELIHPFLYILPFIGLGILTSVDGYETFEIWINNLNQFLLPILLLITSSILLSFLNVSKVTAIKNNEIQKGIYCKPFGFLKISEKIMISQIKEISLIQNEKLFYEITAQSKNENGIVIKSVANKIPAEKELDRIINEIKG